MTREKIDFILKWTACIITLVGAVCTSLLIIPLNIFILATAAVVYLTWSIRIREWSLIVINTAMLLVYGLGSINEAIKLLF